MLYLKDSRGFSLIEMIVVISLLGILVLVATPVYQYSEENIRAKTCFYNQRIIHTAITAWNLEQGTALSPYPSSVQKLYEDGYLQSVPQCTGYSFSRIDSKGHTECPKPEDKHE